MTIIKERLLGGEAGDSRCTAPFSRDVITLARDPPELETMARTPCVGRYGFYRERMRHTV